MGGSGGGGYFRTDPDSLKKQLRESESETKNNEYEAEVAAELSSLLTEYNDRDYEAIKKHLDEIKKSLEKEIDGTVNLLYGGSVSKNTYIKGLSDIDSLVILNNCDLSTKAPAEAKEYFAAQLKSRFPNTDVTIGQLAVTIRFGDAEVQLLPAIKCEDHVKIADKTGNSWTQIKPVNFANALSHTNQHIGYKVIPVVKLAKGILANLPQKQQISGYHAESLAVEVFKNYSGDKSQKAMLKHFFNEASQLVKQPIRDSTGQSRHVDDSLGEPNSVERRIVSDAFARIYRRLNNADRAGSLDEWKMLFGSK